jgi:hypothetical protein
MFDNTASGWVFENALQLRMELGIANGTAS